MEGMNRYRGTDATPWFHSMNRWRGWNPSLPQTWSYWSAAEEVLDLGTGLKCICETCSSCTRTCENTERNMFTCFGGTCLFSEPHECSCPPCETNITNAREYFSYWKFNILSNEYPIVHLWSLCVWSEVARLWFSHRRGSCTFNVCCAAGTPSLLGWRDIPSCPVWSSPSLQHPPCCPLLLMRITFLTVGCWK